ncbi:alpha/beta hydrolase [Aestuariirhabdus litorea]|uniref:Alpha/beta hydrolase n=1 Tax=Aestuariirhabdus litorea TaxID=2528527 RepID=A0A3P3VRB2_9GAMM|nr:alpha/beta hydrolase [Aestuariirhabdus litorea]RRJ85322.1 alpha/beta hydrolase [Aestuariirhabdus litorea]RWW98544.1 alpha/beta hydrolase [Endozoicomonadaceae bacterium GTF-13]
MLDPLLRISGEEACQQYMARRAVPEHPQFFERWAARSETLRQEYRRQRLMQSDNPREFIDLYWPKSLSSDQLHLFIHGGYWQSQHPDSFGFLARPFLERGIPFAVMGYPLCPDVSMVELAQSVQRRLSRLWRERLSLPLEVNRIHLSGHSAGGHLAALMGCQGWGGELVDAVGSILSLSGLFELSPLMHTPINDALRLHSDQARELSPLRLKALLSIPHAMVVGERESVAFHRQSDIFSHHLQIQGIPCERWDAEGCNHFSVLDNFAEPNSASQRWALQQMLPAAG